MKSPQMKAHLAPSCRKPAPYACRIEPDRLGSFSVVLFQGDSYIFHVAERVSADDADAIAHHVESSPDPENAGSRVSRNLFAWQTRQRKTLAAERAAVPARPAVSRDTYAGRVEPDGRGTFSALLIRDSDGDRFVIGAELDEKAADKFAYGAVMSCDPPTEAAALAHEWIATRLESFRPAAPRPAFIRLDARNLCGVQSVADLVLADHAYPNGKAWQEFFARTGETPVQGEAP